MHRAFLPFSVPSVLSVVNIEMIPAPLWYTYITGLILILYVSPAPAARKGSRVQPAVVVHEASVPRAGELSNFRPGEWVSISAGCGLGVRSSRSRRL